MCLSVDASKNSLEAVLLQENLLVAYGSKLNQFPARIQSSRLKFQKYHVAITYFIR